MNAGENVTNENTTEQKTTAKTHPTKTQRAKTHQYTKRWKRNDRDEVDESTISHMANYFQWFEAQSCGFWYLVHNVGPKEKKTRQNYQQLQAHLKTLCLDVVSDGRSVDDFLLGVAHNLRWPIINREAIDNFVKTKAID